MKEQAVLVLISYSFPQHLLLLLPGTKQRVSFDAFVGFATVSVNPLIFLVHFVLLKHISFYIYGPNSRLVNEV